MTISFTIGLALAMSFAAWSQSADGLIDQSLRAKLMRPEVAKLPFLARDRLLLKIDPAYAKLAPQVAFSIIRSVEAEYSQANGIKPLKPFFWYEGCNGCSHFYHDGWQYLTVEYGPLDISVRLGRFEKFVDAYVYASLDADSKVNIDLLPEKRNTRQH